MENNVTSARYLYKSDYLFITRHYLMYSLSLHTCTETLGALQVGLFLTSRYRYRYTFSRLCVLQNCEKRRTIRRTALNNVICETSLPATKYDTSFETLINIRQHAINDIVLEALRQHG